MATYVNGIFIGPFARQYVRYEGALVIRFVPGSLPDTLADDTALALPARRFTETPHRLRGLEADSARWYEGFPDADLRDIAQALEGHDEVEWAAPVFRPADSPDDSEAAVPVPGDLLVEIDDSLIGSVVADLGARGLDHLSAASDVIGSGWHLLRLDGNRLREEIFDAVDDIRDAAIPGIRAFELDWLKLETYHVAFPDGPPDDALWPRQWGPARIEMRRVWEHSRGKPGVTVAVIDSGFDLDHEDVVYEPYSSGKHLDVELLWKGTPNTGPAGRSPFPHGTPVAGVIGASVNNAKGVAGVAGACKIIPIRLGEIPSSGRVAAALGWALEKQVRVVNLSLTTVETSVVVHQVEKCAAASPSMVLCAAAGNALPGDLASTTVGFPARHHHVIGVGASGKDDRRKTGKSADGEQWQSRCGEGLNVVAPGVQLWSTDERGDYGWSDGSGTKVTWYGVQYELSPGDTTGDYIAVFGGTSGATPHVSGLASLLLAQDPLLSALKVREIIESTCSKDTTAYSFDPNPAYTASAAALTWNAEVGCGRIDAGKAVKDASTIAAQPELLLVAPSDPGEQAGCVPFDGFLGRSGVDGLWRIYATTTFDRWVEVAEDDIRKVAPLAGGAKGSRVWVVAHAEIRRVATRPVTADRRVVLTPTRRA